MKRQIKFKFMTRMKILMLSMFFISGVLLINTYNYVKNEVEFIPDSCIYSNSIQTKNGNNLIFADSIKPPTYINEYVATLKNDTVVSYRRKMVFMAEVVYSLGCHDDYTLYRIDDNRKYIKDNNLSKSQIEDYDVKTMNKSMNVIGWMFFLIYTMVFIVLLLASIFSDKSSRVMTPFKIIFNTSAYIFSMITFFYITNYGFAFILLVIPYNIFTIVYYANDDDDINISKRLDKVGIARETITSKVDKLTTAYDSILMKEEPVKEEKEKKVIYI